MRLTDGIRIVLKVRGVAGVHKSQSGNALIPAGFGVGLPEVTDDVWIDFADTACLKWALAIPELANNRGKIRVTPDGLQRVEDLQITALIPAAEGGSRKWIMSCWTQFNQTAQQMERVHPRTGGEFTDTKGSEMLRFAMVSPAL